MSRSCDSRLLPYNWRDVGSSLLPMDILPPGKVLRCGHVDLAGRHRWALIGSPQVIVNLRPEAEVSPMATHALSGSHFCYVHCAIADAPGEHVCYDTTDSRTLRWIKDVLVGICKGVRDDDIDGGGPILVHCRSGKDRTGVIVAALLLLVRPELTSEVLELDYQLSEGRLDLDAFRSAVAGLKQHREVWAEGVDDKKMTQFLLGSAAVRDESFVSGTLKLLLPLINPAGVAVELGMQADEDYKALAVGDEEECVALCRQLLPLTEGGLAMCRKRADEVAGQSKFLVAKAACLEQLGFAELCGPAVCKSGPLNLRAAAEAWESAGNGAVGKLKKVCQSHGEKCSDAI
eukprot:TRINITY_DN2838_c0_g1_i1.p1 TRINITY_DN2838_c0_g1~~TRINITY_DN2838_c0_g1_i1.p1  ORF type:complete len:346 (-),score=53.11 TRINITY_DN2838_c0_g1_i1:764-1801(-)